MATRIFLLRNTSVGTTETLIGDALMPAAGIKWTLVEIRPRFSAAGTLRIKFDTELYYEIRSSVTPGTYAKPHTVALDVAQPHKIEVSGQADTGTITVEVELVVEESPLA